MAVYLVSRGGHAAVADHLVHQLVHELGSHGLPLSLPLPLRPRLSVQVPPGAEPSGARTLARAGAELSSPRPQRRGESTTENDKVSYRQHAQLDSNFGLNRITIPHPRTTPPIDVGQNIIGQGQKKATASVLMKVRSVLPAGVHRRRRRLAHKVIAIFEVGKPSCVSSPSIEFVFQCHCHFKPLFQPRSPRGLLYVNLHGQHKPTVRILAVDAIFPAGAPRTLQRGLEVRHKVSHVLRGRQPERVLAVAEASRLKAMSPEERTAFGEETKQPVPEEPVKCNPEFPVRFSPGLDGRKNRPTVAHLKTVVECATMPGPSCLEQGDCAVHAPTPGLAGCQLNRVHEGLPAFHCQPLCSGRTIAARRTLRTGRAAPQGRG